MNLTGQNCFSAQNVSLLFSALFFNNKLYLISYLGCVLQLLHGDEAALPSVLLHNCSCITQIKYKTTC